MLRVKFKLLESIGENKIKAQTRAYVDDGTREKRRV